MAASPGNKTTSRFHRARRPFAAVVRVGVGTTLAAMLVLALTAAPNSARAQASGSELMQRMPETARGGDPAAVQALLNQGAEVSPAVVAPMAYVAVNSNPELAISVADGGVTAALKAAGAGVHYPLAPGLTDTLAAVTYAVVYADLEKRAAEADDAAVAARIRAISDAAAAAAIAAVTREGARPSEVVAATLAAVAETGATLGAGKAGVSYTPRTQD